MRNGIRGPGLTRPDPTINQRLGVGAWLSHLPVNDGLGGVEGSFSWQCQWSLEGLGGCDRAPGVPTGAKFAPSLPGGEVWAWC